MIVLILIVIPLLKMYVGCTPFLQNPLPEKVLTQTGDGVNFVFDIPLTTFSSDIEGKGGKISYSINSTFPSFLDMGIEKIQYITLIDLNITGFTIKGLFVRGKYLYVTTSNDIDTNSNLTIYDISNPSIPEIVSVLLYPGGTIDRIPYVDEDGSWVYLKYSIFTTIHSVNVEDKMNPVHCGVYNEAGFLWDFDGQGDRLYTTAYGSSNVFRVFDISNPYSFDQLGFDNVNYNWPQSVSVKGDYAFVADASGGGFKIVEITNDVSPTIVSTFPGQYCSLAVSDDSNFAFVFDYGGSNVHIVNVTDKTNPSEETFLNLGVEYSQTPDRVKFEDDKLYVGKSQLRIIDVSNRESPDFYYTGEDYPPGTLIHHLGVQDGFIFAGIRGDGSRIEIYGSNGLRLSAPDIPEEECGRFDVTVVGTEEGTGINISETFSIYVYGVSEDCRIFPCNGYLSNDTDHVCSGHGNCTDYEHCDCEVSENWYGKDCEVTICDKIFSNETKYVCGGHGVCVLNEICNCTDGNYSGEYCQFHSCHGIKQFDGDICGGHGLCVGLDICICDPGYFSLDNFGICDHFSCGKKVMSDSAVCKSRGKCISAQECQCRDNYEGEECETWSCGGYEYKYEKSTCSGKGKCLQPNKCKCFSGYGGGNCENNLMYATVMAPVLSVAGISGILFFTIFVCIVILCCVIGCCICWACIGVLILIVLNQLKGLKKFGKLRNFELHMKEQEMEDDESIAHMKINSDLFEVNFDEIKTESIIGEGGSNSVVFRVKWNGQVCAFKCFKTRLICSNQDKFDEFEKEVEILGSLSHPAIIRFYGATMKPPRVGILMELCAKGEILDFILGFREASGSEYPQKVRMLRQCCSSLEYLHLRNIIHRDLKCENVLVDVEENCKLMDFGLSRCVENMSVAKTKRIGTSVYMAPEIVMSSNYTEKCDVFSFGVMVYVIFTEKSQPYDDADELNIELQVANNPDFRPDINDLKEAVSKYESSKWILDLVVKCWSHDEHERQSFKELRMLFEKKYESGGGGEMNGTSFPIKHSPKNNVGSVVSGNDLHDDMKECKVCEQKDRTILELKEEIETLRNRLK